MALTSNIVQYGKRNLKFAASTLWISKTQDLRDCDMIDSFKSSLKIWLFKEAFE